MGERGNILYLDGEANTPLVLGAVTGPTPPPSTLLPFTGWPALPIHFYRRGAPSLSSVFSLGQSIATRGTGKERPGGAQGGRRKRHASVMTLCCAVHARGRGHTGTPRCGEHTSGGAVQVEARTQTRRVNFDCQEH
jgi:hypothetical protein